MLFGLNLYTIDKDHPFILRLDVSGRVVGAILELFEGNMEGMPNSEEVRTWKRLPMEFCTKILMAGQLKWTPMGKETYAIILDLSK